MTIKTKFAPDDDVYFLIDGKIVKRVVLEFDAKCSVVGTFNKKEVSIIYKLEGHQPTYKEKDLFESPEELSKSLIEQYHSE